MSPRRCAGIGRRAGPPSHRLVAFAAVLLLAALPAIGCRPGHESGRHVVEITGLKFQPDTLRVVVGDTIVWVNRDVVPHTATARGHSWDSGALSANGSWTFVAIRPGESSYLCTLHPAMTGTIVVGAGET